jgi:branched-chain amino acid transport system permease protein
MLDEVLAFIGCAAPDIRMEHVDVRTRRLLQIGTCLLGEAKVALLDEPGAGLSADETVDLAARLIQIPARFGRSVVLIEHDMDLVRAVCSQIVVLDFGKVIAAGRTIEVLETREVVAAYLGEEMVHA